MPLGTVQDTMNNKEDYDGKYLIGTVIVNLDPDGLDRIKALIPGIYDDEESCVWIGPSKFSPFGVGGGYGVYGPPAIGSQILVILQDGDQHHPIYLGSLLAFGKKTAEQKREFHNNAWGFVDPTGNKLLVDMTTKTWTFVHSSLVSMVIKDGTVTVTTPQDHNWLIKGNMNATVEGNMTANVAGNTTMHSDGTCEIQGSTIQLNGG